jgi:tRNA(Ile2) C34 agmatinyltransferase TiaS
MTSYKDLTADQKEKVSHCHTPEELFELAKEEGVEIPDEELENIAGGGWIIPACPQCGSDNTQGYKYDFKCRDCGHIWTT